MQITPISSRFKFIGLVVSLNAAPRTKNIMNPVQMLIGTPQINNDVAMKLVCL